jgi:light-regulated signal transduction histidine kinase (bacteriophytochrome)
MDALISDLLRYSQLAPNEQSTEDISLESAAGEAMWNLSEAIRENGARIELTGMVPVHGNHSQIVQLLQNLLENAIKYRSEQPPKIQMAASPRDNGSVLVEVRDNGIGLDMKYSELIFGVFKRLHGPRDYPGTGIGLASCKRIVELHGGKIWVQSSPGEGCVFSFTLPTASRSAVGNAASAPSNVPT